MPILLKVDDLQALVSRDNEDVLSSVLRAVRMTGAIFYDNDAKGPWVAATPTVAEIAHRVMPGFEYIIPFHIIMVGKSWVWLNEEPEGAVLVTPGEVVMFPRGDEHTCASHTGMSEENPDLDDFYRKGRSLPIKVRINPAGEGDICNFVCGYIGCDASPYNPLLDALPRMLQTRISEASRTLFVNLIAAALSESTGHTAGGESMLARAAELMFVEIVRNYANDMPDDQRSWLSGLRDPHVGRAMHLIHSRPAENWTIDRLARSVGLSRSVFADRFVEHVGVAPIAYLTRWRMQIAARRLDERNTSVAQAAADIGYDSEAAFRRAFKRHVGKTPGEWQKRRQLALAN